MPYLCRTVSGKFIDADNFTKEDFNIDDICHALSHICRWAGHTPKFYCVAQHAVHVARLVASWGAPPVQVLMALHHDSAEAYTGDIIRPVKKMFAGGEFHKLEHVLTYTIISSFGVTELEFENYLVFDNTIAQADDIITATEIRDILQTDPWLADFPEPMEQIIPPWSGDFAGQVFLDMHLSLCAQLDR